MDRVDILWQTRASYLNKRAQLFGQFTDLVIFDPQSRGSDYVAKILTEAGLDFEIDETGDPVPNPIRINPAVDRHHNG